MDEAGVRAFAAIIQAIAQAAGVIVAGLWTYWLYIRRAERYPHIETSAEIHFVEELSDCWVVELCAYLENKGKVENRVSNLHFNLYGLPVDQPTQLSSIYGNQIDFPIEIVTGDFLPSRLSHFVVYPGVKAKYSFVACVPKNLSVIIMHSWFDYSDIPNMSHSMECTASVLNASREKQEAHAPS